MYQHLTEALQMICHTWKIAIHGKLPQWKTQSSKDTEFIILIFCELVDVHM